jgi:hypothetical protein
MEKDLFHELVAMTRAHTALAFSLCHSILLPFFFFLLQLLRRHHRFSDPSQISQW